MPAWNVPGCFVTKMKKTIFELYKDMELPADIQLEVEAFAARGRDAEECAFRAGYIMGLYFEKWKVKINPEMKHDKWGEK